VSRPAEDSDPLLAFSTEPGAAPPVASPSDPATQPVAATEDPRRLLRAPAIDPLIGRVDRLERALEDSKKQVSTLKSEVATLVRALSDIKKPTRLPALTFEPKTRSGSRGLAAVLGIVMGLGLGIAAWMYLSGGADSTIAASPPVASQGVVADHPPAVEGPTASEEPKTSAPIALAAFAAPKAPQAPQAPKAPQTARYVGTLAIDSSPAGEVFVDRQTAGRTPLRLTNLRAGSHLIWIERDGYRRFTRVVQVPSDRVTRLSADLEPIPAR
jgi:PEGA domain